MRNKLLALLVLTPLLISCSNNEKHFGTFVFDTYVDCSVNELNDSQQKTIEEMFSYLDKLSDNYQARDIVNVYSINQTNNDIKVDKDLYDMLKSAYEISADSSYFNIMCGSLAKLWKNALKSQQIPDKSVIENELNKIKNSSIIFKENNVIQRVGEAEIDLGGFVKGYALDKVKEYLVKNELPTYLINAGSSSVLLGQKKDESSYLVGIKELNDYSISLKNCFVSTSGSLEQGATINGKKYSHIVNPITGDAQTLYDAVVVVSNNGALGDVMSTSLFLSSINEIKQAETKFGLKTIVIKDSNIVYINEGLKNG